MSNQMMQFDEPERQEQEYAFDPDPRYINRDPREQPRQDQPDEPLYGGYTGQTGQTYYGEKLRPRSRPVKKRVRWWVPLVVTLLVLLIPMMGFGLMSRTVPAPMQFPMHMKGGDWSQNYTFSLKTVQGRTLVIHNDNGAVQIHSGDQGDHDLAVRTSGFRFGGPGSNDGNAPVTFDPNLKDPNSTASSLTITAQSTFGPLSGVGLDVTVPQGMNVQIVDDSGHVQIENFTGNVEVTNESGSISTDSVNGQVKLTAQSGSIDLENAQLSGSSTINTDSGSIHFDGSIDQHGNYTFTSNSGSVDVSLPQNTSFHLKADSSSGDVNNDFTTNDVGSAPRPPLTIHTDSGSINVQQR